MSSDAKQKLDFFKANLEYAAKPKPSLVDVGRAAYLAAEGKGSPGGTEFEEAVGALYGMAYTIKMTLKSAGRGDYTVAKLEALWPDCDPMGDKEQWKWQVMIRTPEFVTEEDLGGAADVLRERGKLKRIESVVLVQLNEGLCIQALHVGAYSDETKTIAAMKEYAECQGFRFRPSHHEIYLSDPRRVEPARLKTILRIPVVKFSGS